MAKGSQRFAKISEVSSLVKVPISSVRRWCVEGRVLARKTPGDIWRIEVDAEGWPLEPGIHDQEKDQ